MTIWKQLNASWRHNQDRWLLAVAALALAASLLAPGLTVRRSLFDHVIVLDVTQSMGVTDMQLEGKPVSRLGYAKHALRRSLLQLPCGSKVGWGIFTEYRSLLLLAPIEVCANLNELRSSLELIDSRMAWSGNSEIAKGLHSAIGIARLLPEKPSLVFVTDGQEAPPVDSRFRRSFDDKPGEVAGLIVGVGDPRASPIPKIDPQGRPLGFWRAEEVQQADPRSSARSAALSGGLPPDPAAGREHLSSLHEPYLRLLAREHGMVFHRLQSQQALSAALMSPAMARTGAVHTDAHLLLAALAFVSLLLRHLRSTPRSAQRRRRKLRHFRRDGRLKWDLDRD